jgi:HemY protein
MLWSLLKVLIFVSLVAGLTWGADALLASGQGLRIAFAGMEFTLGPLQAVVLVLALVIVLWLAMALVGLLVAFLRFLNGDETALSRYFDRSRERKGFQALSEGMLALAAGENRVALSRAVRAERLLQKPELTSLLIAQSAEAIGDHRRAEEAWKALLTHDASRFVGVKGLLAQRLAAGDAETARKLAEKALELKPRNVEMQDVLLKLQSEAQDWTGARNTLAAKLKSGTVPKDLYRRRDAILALQEASGVLDENASAEAREAAIAANKLSPDLIPAAAMAARQLAAKGDTKGAARVIRRAWEAQPHPDLAAAFADIVPDETPAQRLRRFRMMTDVRPDHPETRMLLAELEIAAEDFPAARRALGDLATSHPTRRALSLMAAIERGSGADEAEVRAWLARALTAPRGPQWCCDKCKAIHAHWGPICDNCGGFDTLSWREPVEADGPSATGAELLPLLVKPAARPAPSPAKDTVVEEPIIEEILPEKDDEPIDLAAIARSAN